MSPASRIPAMFQTKSGERQGGKPQRSRFYLPRSPYLNGIATLLRCLLSSFHQTNLKDFPIIHSKQKNLISKIHAWILASLRTTASQIRTNPKQERPACMSQVLKLCKSMAFSEFRHENPEKAPRHSFPYPVFDAATASAESLKHLH